MIDWAMNSRLKNTYEYCIVSLSLNVRNKTRGAAKRMIIGIRRVSGPVLSLYLPSYHTLVTSSIISYP